MQLLDVFRDAAFIYIFLGYESLFIKLILEKLNKAVVVPLRVIVIKVKKILEQMQIREKRKIYSWGLSWHK